MFKTIVPDSKEFLRSGEARIVSFIKTASGLELDDRKLKSLACDEAKAFAQTLSPVPGKRIILVSALGSFEVWGQNKKADAFPYRAINGLPPEGLPPDFFRAVQNKIPKIYGQIVYKSKFDEHGSQIGGGNTFYEHINRLPRASGRIVYLSPGSDIRCGYVLASFWNKIMHRLELVIEVWESKLMHICRAIDNGELPGVSMACDIPFDRCYICNHLALTGDDYCVHLNKTLYKRGFIFPNGKVIAMINDFPVFFDISIVKHPAAEEGRTLFKVASFDNEIDNQVKTAGYTGSIMEPEYSTVNNVHKTNIDSAMKLQSMRMYEHPFSHAVIGKLQKFPVRRLVKYLSVLGIFPTGHDFAQLLFNKTATESEVIGKEVELNLLPLIMSDIDKLNINETEFQNINAIMKSASDEDFFDETEFKNVINIVEGYLPLKSYHPDFVNQRKTASYTGSCPVDVSGNLDKINDIAKAVLISRIILEPELLLSMQSLLKSPGVVNELKKVGILPGNYKFDSLPVYPDFVKSYVDKVYQSRENLFRG